MQAFWIAALIFGIVIALFAVQNSAPTTIRFLWISAEGVALSVLVMICAALGALVTLMFGMGREVRLQWSRRSVRRLAAAHEKRIAELEKTVEQLTTEKAALETQLAAFTSSGGAPLYEAVPVPTEKLDSASAPADRPALPEQR
ncbi:MAG: lipopolysaccharide assembly LapA domain-containing protein [Chloroflexota bacterium]